MPAAAPLLPPALPAVVRLPTPPGLPPLSLLPPRLPLSPLPLLLLRLPRRAASQPPRHPQ